MVQPLWKIVWQFLKSLNIELPYDQAIPLLVYTQEKYPREMKTHVDTKICTLFIATLLLRARMYKQLKCPSSDEWMNTMYSPMMEYYLAMIKE